MGEAAVLACCAKSIILRISWMFGEHGNNFVKTMLRLGESRDEISVVSDQRGCPSYVGDVVTTIGFFVENIREHSFSDWGIFHCSSQGETTWYQFADTIFDKAKHTGLLNKRISVIPIPSSDYLTPAPRPLYSVLNTNKLTTLMGKSLPHWEDGLNKLLSNIQTYSKDI